MDKFKKLLMFVGVTLLVIDLGIIFFIDLLRKNPIHSFERDIARDNIYNVCLASLILFFVEL